MDNCKIMDPDNWSAFLTLSQLWKMGFWDHFHQCSLLFFSLSEDKGSFSIWEMSGVVGHPSSLLHMWKSSQKKKKKACGNHYLGMPTCIQISYLDDFKLQQCGDPTPIFERVRWHDHHLKMCALRVHFVQREKSLEMRISSVIWKMTRWVYKFSDSDFG